jgi:myosin heavy subunit
MLIGWQLRHESVSVPMTSTQALDARDALAKEVGPY